MAEGQSFGIDFYHSTAILFSFHTNTRHQTEAGRESSLAPFHELGIVIIIVHAYTGDLTKMAAGR